MSEKFVVYVNYNKSFEETQAEGVGLRIIPLTFRLLKFSFKLLEAFIEILFADFRSRNKFKSHVKNATADYVHLLYGKDLPRKHFSLTSYVNVMINISS